jgi:hypothetical protein
MDTAFLQPLSVSGGCDGSNAPLESQVSPPQSLESSGKEVQFDDFVRKL